MLPLPPSKRDLRKLNLGCGDDKREGYINVDLLDGQQPDVVANVLDLHDFPSGHYEEIIAQDILEHFKRVDTRRALYEWNRVLALGGRIFLRTTFLTGLLRRLENPAFQSIQGQAMLIHGLFSGQGCEGDFHLTAFTEPLFRYYLWECGFDIVELGVLDEWLLECTARKARDFSFSDLLDESLDEETFLTSAYQAILLRPPDDYGLGSFTKGLKAGQFTRRGVVQQLLLSDERQNTMMQCAPKFPCMLGGHGKTAASTANANAPRPPVDLDKLIHGESDDHAFLIRAYQTILDRPADGWGLTHYKQLLREKHLSRHDVVHQLLHSEERGTMPVVTRAPQAAFPPRPLVGHARPCEPVDES